MEIGSLCDNLHISCTDGSEIDQMVEIKMLILNLAGKVGGALDF